MTNRLLTSCLVGTVACVLSGCSSRPVKPQADDRAASVFAHSADATQKAARDALVVLGFEIKKVDPLYVEGYRPHKVGAVVGSGGETAGVWLEPAGADQTRVLVDTAKSLVGIAGQKNWDSDILAEMAKVLRKPE